ncbi:hypothetical protein B0H13DRAFT_1650574 [Mycena leptocephala]|nr:hypothetical protein B0H13DRAFT_1650574 [Mycena leptocephala]
MAEAGLVQSSQIADQANHDPDLYFEDGNIILSVKDRESRTTYLRLHRSILVKHSPNVFGNMFAMPPPPTMDQYDGLPLVEMPDDGDELRGLITLLYDPHGLPTLFRRFAVLLRANDFTLRLLGPTRLAKKYQIDWICNMVAAQLKKRWPTTLLGWDSVAEKEEATRIREFYGPWTPEWDDGTVNVRQPLPELASSIFLARECNEPSVLPFAFFHLLVSPLELPGDDQDYEKSPWKVRTGLVSSEDWRRLFFARQGIARWFSRLCPLRFILHWKPCQGGRHAKKEPVPNGMILSNRS